MMMIKASGQRMMRLMLPEFSDDMDENDPEYYDERQWPEEL